MATTRLYTADDLLTMGQDRVELMQGVLYEMSPTGERHTVISLRIGAALLAYEESTGNGTAFGADGGFVLSRDPDTVLSPDAAFVLAGRLPEDRDPTRYPALAPDLAVEVLSPSDTLAGAKRKAMQYIGTGTALVWLIEPERQRVTAIDSVGHERIYSGAGVLDAGTVLPGFSLSLERLFRRSS